MSASLGPFPLNKVTEGDCRKLTAELPDNSIDVAVTSPSYWGQRLSEGNGVEADPRVYVAELAEIFGGLLPKMKASGVLWVNIGDAYNTPVNWRLGDLSYSTLGPDKTGLPPENSAYIKPRHKRQAYIDKTVPWLSYGNLLALPYRLVLAMCDAGWLFRGEIIWRKRNPMPEGRCRRPHRQHESIYLFARSERHAFRTSPPVGSVWEFGNEKIDGLKHFSRFPEELPKRCIKAYGKAGSEIIVLDQFSGSGTTGVAARALGCSYIGFEIDHDQVIASNERIGRIKKSQDEHEVTTQLPQNEVQPDQLYRRSRLVHGHSDASLFGHQGASASPMGQQLALPMPENSLSGYSLSCASFSARMSVSPSSVPRRRGDV